MNLSELEDFDDSPHTSGLWMRYACPLCGADKPKDRAHQCFGVKDGGYFCHRCGVKGKFEDIKITKEAKVTKKGGWLRHFQ